MGLKVGNDFKIYNLAITEHRVVETTDLITMLSIDKSYSVQGCFRSESKLYVNDIITNDLLSNNMFVITTVGDLLYFFKSIKYNKLLNSNETQFTLIGVPFEERM